MMNLVALSLLFSSLFIAGVWSPHPNPNPAVVKEGHRVIVVEYERVSSDSDAVVGKAAEKLKEAADVLPNGLSAPVVEPKEKPVRERICDAYGVCKEKISGLVGKSKEKAAEVGDEKAKEVGEGAKEAVGDAVEKTKEIVGEIAGRVKRIGEDTVDRAKGIGGSTFDKVKEVGKETVDRAKEMGKETVDEAKDIGRKTADKFKETTENVNDKVVETKKNLTDLLRRAKDVAVDAAAMAVTVDNARSIAAMMELLAFATAYGMCIWVTFVSSHVLARALPRQQFGVVQSKIYPIYFRALVWSVALVFLAHLAGMGAWKGHVGVRMQSYNLVGVIGLVFVNMLFLEPKATKVMFERMKMEKEEGRGRDMADMLEPTPATTRTTTTTSAMDRASVEQEAVKIKMVDLNRRLKDLNSYSSILNILTLIGLTCHLVHLSRRLEVNCY